MAAVGGLSCTARWAPLAAPSRAPGAGSGARINVAAAQQQRPALLASGGARRRRAASSSSSSAAAGSDAPAIDGSSLGLIVECDGALVDAHGEGHRVAFNRAFNEIGHDCTSWTPAVFYDLMRLGDGTGEGLIAAYYGIRGWPVMLASSERGAFLKKVHGMKVRILREMAAKGEIPLRSGVTQLLDDALSEGAKVTVVAATASVPDDALVSSAMLNLGPNRAFQLRVVSVGGDSPTDAAAASSQPGGGGGGGESSDSEGEGQSFEQRVASARAKAKSQAAEEFIRAYNLQKGSGMGLAIDPKIKTAAERAGMLSPQFMAALADSMGVPAKDTLVVAGGNTIMEAGKSAGMLTLGVPPSVAARGGFSAADAIFDGYGAGGGLTWWKAKILLAKARQQQQKQ